MDPKNFFSPKISLFFCLSLNFLATLPSKTLCFDQKFLACEPKSCSNNGVQIRYPFWLKGLQQPYCGYHDPNFELSCNDDHQPELTISDDEYIVEDIRYETNSFHVINSAAYNHTCPIPLHSLSLNQTPFRLVPGFRNLSLLSHCNSMPEYWVYPINCSTDATHVYFATFDIEILEDNNYSLASHSCRYLVEALVLSDAKENYTEILKTGFLLNWIDHSPSCSSCNSTGGRCGSENESFVCFCPDGRRPSSCNDGRGSRWRLKVGIGVGAAFGGGILMCIVFFIYQHRNPKKYGPSFSVSRSLTSDPSSEAEIEKGVSYFGVHLFTYVELEEATSNFDSSKELGDGGFGTVYYGKLRDGRTVAVKRLYENNYKRVEQFMNEVEILTRLRHRHLVSLYGCTSRHSRELLLVYEYIPNGTVADHLHGDRVKPGALPWSIRMNIAVETASALKYLHASDIIHRDVKTNNILLDNNFCVKVADFGLSRLFPTDVTHVSTAPQGTPGYVDPEYHQCYQLTDKSDVYSFGVVLIELISSMPAVDITRHRHEINLANLAINRIQRHSLHELVDPNLGFESDYATRTMITAVAELAFQCLQSEKDTRPCMEEVLEILEQIRNQEYSTEEAEKLDTRADLELLKNGPQLLSPDSVTFRWISPYTTSSSSG
ncbi:hypothetical protein K2173_028217 [Erythroxylum novogranatense]|uniref:non-specific serine/threonine protein kinase n=1 Tax=Erythroxylum novogranatense TaxID=1862640 RepID=A0AAV8U4Y2_9ROSI|nr:hypothetical protein K2173_028217 [Erythroxylum novogranatense]